MKPAIRSTWTRLVAKGVALWFVISGMAVAGFSIWGLFGSSNYLPRGGCNAGMGLILWIPFAIAFLVAVHHLTTGLFYFVRDETRFWLAGTCFIDGLFWWIIVGGVVASKMPFWIVACLFLFGVAHVAAGWAALHPSSRTSQSA